MFLPHDEFENYLITQTASDLKFKSERNNVKGYLKELLGKRKNKAQDTIQDTERILYRATSPPLDASIIHFILGVSYM